jgi:radical SAM superfamily enzyme YgiQ (UPF0313 family)
MRFSWAATMRADQGVRMPDETWTLCKQSGLRRLLVGVESGDNEMLRRIKKDITIDKVFQTAEHMQRLEIAGIFPFIVGFPDESDASVRSSIACARRLRAMSAAFETPIFYFKPYPGSAIVADAVSRGYSLPSSLAEWSVFDYVAGLPGPWVSSEKFRLIERFRFFLDLAYSGGMRWTRWLRRFAQARCERTNFRWPVEMYILRRFRTSEKLS